ncbi:50S ribosomal protein L5 [Candidatus Woesearchaeota archaeon]|nr:50S ribosomal protein L5 [Candidatus Woesearchaeota archaeon]
MKEILIEKLTLNVGAGKDQALLEKGMKLLKNITGIDPVKTITTKRIPSWGVRPGLPIGTKITLRKQDQIKDLVTRFIKSKEGKLRKSCFDSAGNVSFGIHEYIDVPGLEYDPQIGIIGFQICITLKRKGFSIKYKGKKIGKKHQITQDEAIEYMNKTYGVEISE